MPPPRHRPRARDGSTARVPRRRSPSSCTRAEGDRGDARPGRATRAPRRLGAGRAEGTKRSWRLPALAHRRAARAPAWRRDAARDRRSAARPRTSERCPDRVGRPPTDAHFAASGEGIQVVPSRDGLELDVPRRRVRCCALQLGRPTASRGSRSRPRARAHDPEALAMGIDRRMCGVQDVLLGDVGPDHEPPARRAGARRHARRRPAGRSRSTTRSESGPRSAASALRR